MGLMAWEGLCVFVCYVYCGLELPQQLFVVCYLFVIV